jgi:IS1 family transposase
MCSLGPDHLWRLPNVMVGTNREGRRGIKGRQVRTICTSHVERLNGTQRVFLKRLNRLTLCFSKKLPT